MLKYEEYMYHNKKNHFILFHDIIDIKNIKLFYEDINEMLIEFIIEKNTRIFVTVDKSFCISNEKNFKLIEKNVYEYILTSGNNQHYIQQYYMKRFLGLEKEQKNNINRYVYNKKGNELKNLNYDSFNNIGSDANYFSDKKNSYLDQYISSLEKKSNVLYSQIKEKIDNNVNKISDNLKFIENVFNFMCYPFCLKSSYTINSVIFNTKKSSEKYISQEKLNIEQKKLLKQNLSNQRSEYYYYIIENYIIKSMKNLNTEFNEIQIIKIKDIPLSENVLFSYNKNLNEFDVGYNKENRNALFLFDENHILLFLKDKKDQFIIKEKIINLKEYIIDNAHDFLITKNKIEEKEHLVEKKDYFFLSLEKEISTLIKFHKLLNGENLSLKIEKHNSIFPMLFETDKYNIFIFKQKNYLACNEIKINNVIYYISNENLQKIEINNYYRFYNNHYLYTANLFTLQNKNITLYSSANNWNNTPVFVESKTYYITKEEKNYFYNNLNDNNFKFQKYNNNSIEKNKSIFLASASLIHKNIKDEIKILDKI